MKFQPGFLILLSVVGRRVVLGADNSNQPFTWVRFSFTPSAPGYNGIPAIWWPILEVVPLQGCNGGWKVSATVQCSTYYNPHIPRDCNAGDFSSQRSLINSAAIQVSVLRKDGSDIDITKSITYLCLQDGCQYIFNRQPPLTDSTKFFGIGDKNPLECASTSVTQQEGGYWNVAFQYKGCSGVPKWLNEFYVSGQDIAFANRLLAGATSVNLVDCTSFNNVDISKLKFTLT